MSKRRTPLLLLGGLALGLGWFLWKHRKELWLLRAGYRLYPDGKADWLQLVVRLARAAQEGERFSKRYPYARHNLAYGPLPRQKLDVFWPQDASGAPVLVYVYGGGWETGRKEIYAAAARELVTQGFVSVIIDYRLYPEVHYPDLIRDAAAAVRWAAANATRFGGDPRSIVLAGQSAGAHIVALLGLDSRFLAEVQVPPEAVRAVVGMSGPFDLPGLTRDLADGLGWPGVGSHLGAIMGGRENLKVASPIHHVGTHAPPFLLLHGRQDRLVPCGQSEALAAALDAVGADVELRVLEGINHFSIVLDLFGSPGQTPTMIHQFVQQRI